MEKKRKKEIQKIIESFIDPLTEKESGVILYGNEDGYFTYSSYISEKEVAASIATIFSDWFDDGDERARAVAKGILLGIAALVHKRDKSGRIILNTVTDAAMSAVKDMIEDLKKDIGQDEDDDDEDCGTCKFNKVCSQPQAVKYRKANGIPAPKRHPNKRCKENEKGS